MGTRGVSHHLLTAQAGESDSLRPMLRLCFNASKARSLRIDTLKGRDVIQRVRGYRRHSGRPVTITVGTSDSQGVWGRRELTSTHGMYDDKKRKTFIGVGAATVAVIAVIGWADALLERTPGGRGYAE